MAIELAKNYVNLLDEVYQNDSLTADLSADARLVRAGASAKSVLYPSVSLSGLGDYSRNSGYTNGTVDVSYREIEFDYDRGIKISVDAMDNQESFDVAFGHAGAELIRTRVVPEADAYTFSSIASSEGITKQAETLAGAEELLSSLLSAQSKMDEDEVTLSGRILYITPTLYNSILALDTTKSREVLAGFSKIVKVPQGRFYTAIDLLDGASAGEEAGGYKQASGAKNINFLIVQEDAVIKIDKHVVGDVISPAQNPDADSYILKYRKYGTVSVLPNKAAGVYLSYQE